MRLLLAGCGGVGESIAKILYERDPKGQWLEKVVLGDYDRERAQRIANELGNVRFVPERIDASDQKNIMEVIQKHDCDYVMDAAPPYMTDGIFDAAFEAGAGYFNMGTWSEPKPAPDCYGIGKDCFHIFMADHNFAAHDKWESKGLLAIIGLGVEPGVVDVFARFAAEYLFDELHTIDVKDGSNMADPCSSGDDVVFPFNVWTVLDECMNPNVTWYKDKGYVCDRPLAGEEVFEFPDGIGPVKLYQIEHEETCFMPRYLEKYGLKRVSYKIGLEDTLVGALRAVDALGLRSLEPVKIEGVSIVPRDLVAKLAPQPSAIADKFFGKTCGGILCEGIKDGKHRKLFLYQTTDQQESMKRFGTSAIVSQTGFGAAIGIELAAKGVWSGKGVFTPECFDPRPYLKIMEEADFPFGILEYPSEYKNSRDKEEILKLLQRS